MKDYAYSFYFGKAWRKCRIAYLKSQHHICERCNGIAKVVHHKEYITPMNITDNNITLSANNLEALCQDCHNKEHHANESGNNSLCYKFDANGNIVYAPH